VTAHEITPLALRAATFARGRHARQQRKYTGEPYFGHLAEVAGLVSSVTDDPATIAAAYLHDTVEDTTTSIDEICTHFGADVADLVAAVTDVSKPSDGNRAYRKAMDRDHLAGAPGRAQTIKLADLLSNTSSIVAHDPGFAAVYLREKAALLEVLTHGDGDLYQLACTAYQEAIARLSESESGVAW
jgi:(p)ppGpp synthase/HD superfamily hydrolase